jgi:hypothetical protein
MVRFRWSLIWRAAAHARSEQRERAYTNSGEPLRTPAGRSRRSVSRAGMADRSNVAAREFGAQWGHRAAWR